MPPSTQGHVNAAVQIGGIYDYGQGVAVDYERAMAAYKIGAEGGNAICQCQLGSMLHRGDGIDSPDQKQALAWLERAAAQDLPQAVHALGVMALRGHGRPLSWRDARQYYQRAIELGHCQLAAQDLKLAAQDLKFLNGGLQQVHLPHAGEYAEHRPLLFLTRPSSPPSWTSGLRSTAPPATT